jgi:hypothetical protein
MFALNRLIVASIFMISQFICIRAYADDRFTTQEFLEWTEVSRRSYIQTSMMMANMIANENDHEQSTCISEWYAEDRRGREQYIYDVMKKAEGYHPMGVIMAVLENKCGPFKYK